MGLGLGLGSGLGFGLGLSHDRARGVRAARSDGGSTRPSDPETRHAASLGRIQKAAQTSASWLSGGCF